MSDDKQPYIRVRKMWSRNSGFAQYSWLYYVDLVNKDGMVFGYKLHEYGLDRSAAHKIANDCADFFGWPRRFFEEKHETKVVLHEVKGITPS